MDFLRGGVVKNILADIRMHKIYLVKTCFEIMYCEQSLQNTFLAFRAVQDIFFSEIFLPLKRLIISLLIESTLYKCALSGRSGVVSFMIDSFTITFPYNIKFLILLLDFPGWDSVRKTKSKLKNNKNYITCNDP